MSDTADGLRDDISFLRRMAEQGRRGPILGGVFLAAAGVIYGAACLAQWAMSRGWINAGPEGSTALWWGASILFAVVWLILFMRLRGAQAASASANFAFSMAWTGCALGMAAMSWSVYEVARRIHDPSVQYLLVPLTFAFYGTAWFVSAAMARKPWMYVIAALAYLTSCALALVSGDIDSLLVMSAGLVLTLVVPGVALAANPDR